MAKKKSNPPKKPNSTNQKKIDLAKTRASLQNLEEKAAKAFQMQAELLIGLAKQDPTAAEKLLAGLRDPKKVRTIAKRNKGPLKEECLIAIFQELESGVQQQIQPKRYAFLGPLHSYSHLATLERFGSSAELVPVQNIAAVFEAVSSKQVDAGLVPIENSTDGRIIDTLELLTRASVKICGEVPLRIHHNLLGIGKRSDVKEVCSKPQAISQCREWLAKHMPTAKQTSMSSTTAAAERAAKDKSVAAIASYQAGVEYGLKQLAKNIEDNKDNITRFAVIGPESAKRTGDDKTSLMFELAHEPGALADAMMIFKRKNRNLTWIESFPKPGSRNEYLFFVELLGHQTDLPVRKALAALEKKTVRLEVLGSYPQTVIE